MLSQMILGLALIQNVHIEDVVSLSALKTIKSLHTLEVDGKSVQASVEDYMGYSASEIDFTAAFYQSKRDFNSRDELKTYVKNVLCKTAFTDWTEVFLANSMNSKNLKLESNPWMKDINNPSYPDYVQISYTETGVTYVNSYSEVCDSAKVGLQRLLAKSALR